MNAIADTGFLVALVAKRDRFHDWAIELARQLTWPVVTCEPVLAETAFHLGSSKRVTWMLIDGTVRVGFDCASHIHWLDEMAERYADLHPDLADLCVIRMSELYPHHKVITIDEQDFSVYRRNKREVIPLLCPPRK